jgi:hypothetical protein
VKTRRNHRDPDKFIGCRCWSSGLQTPCGLQVDTNVSDEYTASIFRIEDVDSRFLRNVVIYLHATRRYNPEDQRRHLRCLRTSNLKLTKSYEPDKMCTSWSVLSLMKQQSFTCNKWTSRPVKYEK